MSYSECPCCESKKRLFSKPVQTGIYICPTCGAIFGDCYLGDSYMLVRPFFTSDPEADKRHKYFDFTCLGSKGIERRHGWYDPETRLVTQIG